MVRTLLNEPRIVLRDTSERKKNKGKRITFSVRAAFYAKGGLWKCVASDYGNIAWERECERLFTRFFFQKQKALMTSEEKS